MSDSKNLKLSGDSRFLQKVALKLVERYIETYQCLEAGTKQEEDTRGQETGAENGGISFTSNV